MEEVTGESSGKIRSVKVRTIWTHGNFIGRGVVDRIEGKGIIFTENGETITYTIKSIGQLFTKFGYRLNGRIKFRAHSQSRLGKLRFLHGKSGRFMFVGRGKFVTKV